MYTITVTTPNGSTTHSEWNYYATVKARIAALRDLHMQGFYLEDIGCPVDDQWLVNADGTTVTVITTKTPGDRTL